MKKDVAQAQEAVAYVYALQQKCTAWGGPLATIDEVESCIRHQTF